MNLETISVLVGAILVATGAIGGGIELRELKIPPVKTPTRIVAFVAGVFFVLLGVGLKMEEKTAAVQAASVEVTPVRRQDPVPVSARAEDDLQWLESQVKSTVLKASSTEAEARAQRDPAILRTVYTGDALRKVSDSVKMLEQQGVYVESVLHGQDGWDIQLSPDRQRAEVKLTETWSTRFRRVQDGTCAAEMPARPVPQMVSLRRAGESWVVTDFNTMGDQPAFQQCSVP